MKNTQKVIAVSKLKRRWEWLQQAKNNTVRGTLIPRP